MSCIAREDPTLAAVVVARLPLYYREGADPSVDRPAHVRAGSSLAWVPGGIALVQDDANFLAVVDPRDGTARAIALPAGYAGRRQFDERRGNKQHKLDLEACVAVESEGRTVLVAAGSGSTSGREHVVLVDGWESGQPGVELIHAPRLYATLRREQAFAGSELNVEGAVHLGGRLRLFGRGNGALRDAVRPANATCDLEWQILLAHLRDPDRIRPPRPTDVVRYELGALGGIPLSFTDATVSGGTVLFSATAEDSPDVTRDGRVTGSAIGVIDGTGRARWAPLTEPSGRPFAGKVEGLVGMGGVRGGARDRLYVVVDADDPETASVLCTVQLRGGWSD
ncbi:MAG: hypothetical protein ABR499_19160 [Gemmatimonadaceae bacterium]